MRPRLVLLLALGLLGLLARAAPAPAAPTAPEARLLALVNAERASAGLAPLQWNEDLARLARAHVAEIRERGDLSHEGRDGSILADRVARAGLRLSRAAENLARAPDVREAHDALMASAGHRANILDERLVVAGFGVLEGDDGAWIVQDFGVVAPRLDEDAAERGLLSAVRSRGWAMQEDPTLSRAMEDAVRAMVAEEEPRASGIPGAGCWTLATTGPDPLDLPDGRAPHCAASRAGVAARWARTESRPLGAWFVAITVAP